MSKSALAIEQQAQVEALVTRSGIPLSAAWRVVRKEATLDAVLKSLLRQEVCRGLVERGMARSLAGQVAAGELAEGKAWVSQRAMQHPGYSHKRSRLREAAASAEPMTLGRLAAPPLSGTVVEVQRYDLRLTVPDEEPSKLDKHELKLVVAAPDWPAVAAALQAVPEIAAQGLSGTAALGERLVIDLAARLDLLDRRRPVRLVFRDGETLGGRPVWCSAYELGVQVPRPGAAPCEVAVFFHALLRIEDEHGQPLLAHLRKEPPTSPAALAQPRGADPGKGKPRPGAKPPGAKPPGRSGPVPPKRPAKKKHARR